MDTARHAALVPIASRPARHPTILSLYTSRFVTRNARHDRGALRFAFFSLNYC
jgi:hypothetical protein